MGQSDGIEASVCPNARCPLPWAKWFPAIGPSRSCKWRGNVKRGWVYIIEARPVTRTLLDQGESFNGWPAWAVPALFGEQAASTPLNTAQIGVEDQNGSLQPVIQIVDEIAPLHMGGAVKMFWMNRMKSEQYLT